MPDLQSALVESGLTDQDVEQPSNHHDHPNCHSTAYTKSAQILQVASDASVLFDPHGNPVAYAWAYYAIGFSSGIRGGVQQGLAKNTTVELMAAVNGLEWVLGKSESHQQLCVLIDCDFTAKWIEELNARKVGTSGNRGMAATDQHVHGLLVRLDKVIRQRTVRYLRVNSITNEHHRMCHQLCSRQLRDLMLRKPDLHAQVIQGIPTSALDRAIRERQKCLDRVAELTVWIGTLMAGRQT